MFSHADAVRFESMPEFFQFAPYFEVIVNLAVEGDSEIPVFGKNRLVPGVQVDDFQARRAHREKAGLKNALLVRPPVDQRCGGLLNAPRRRAPVLMRISYDSAQLFVPRGAPFECLDALPIIVTRFGRLTFRRSLPRPAMHGSNRCAIRTGETWPDRP